MAHKSNWDRQGDSFLSGDKAESSFVKAIKKTQFKIEDAPLSMQHEHVDYIVTSDTDKKLFEVKARKKKNRSDSNVDDNIIFVEFKNVAGYDGWLYGKADFIAFEREDYFLIVSREALAKLAEKLVDLNKKATRPTMYQSYTRTGRRDVVSILSFGDILDNLKYRRLNK